MRLRTSNTTQPLGRSRSRPAGAHPGCHSFRSDGAFHQGESGTVGGVQFRPVSVPDDLEAIDELIEEVSVADGYRPLGEHKYLALTSGPPAEVVGVVGEDDGHLVAYVALSPTGRGVEWGMEVMLHPG